MNSTDDARFVQLLFHLFNSVALTVFASLFVLWRYRVAVLKGMNRGSDEELTPHDVRLRDGCGRKAGVAESLAWERRQQRHIALSYLLSTFVCALPLAFSHLYLIQIDRIYPSRVMMLALVYTMASAPMIVASLALPPLRALLTLASLFILLAATSVSSMVVEREMRGGTRSWLTFLDAFVGLAVAQWNQIAFIYLLTWPRRLRGVAPLTFVAIYAFGLAPFIASRFAAAEGRPDLGVNRVFVLMALPAGWVAWQGLHHLAGAYERKRFSDAQLLAQIWWMILVTHSWAGMSSGTNQPWLSPATAAAAVALLMFPLLSHVLLTWQRPATSRPVARNLLLLRVFGYTARTQRLFDRIAERWRLFGPVTVIAAPDVVARTIDPGDYLHWLTGKVDEPFVSSRAALATKLVALDMSPDPDGRYRINEFCCRQNTWQATVVELIERADAVIMDVRGVTDARHGCKFELDQLANRAALDRLVLVTDATTEQNVLEAAFGPRLTSVHLVEVKRSNEISIVFKALLEATA